MDDRTRDALEAIAKLFGAVAALAILSEKVVKPYRTWRLRTHGITVREVLAPDLDQISSLLRAQAITNETLERMWEDIDLFLELAVDNRGRHDATADLLSAAGLAPVGQRVGDNHRERIDELLVIHNTRRRLRRRKVDG